MARYIGPACRVCRREGMKLFLKGERCFTPKCAAEPNRRLYPPGQHAQRRRKVSEFGTQMREKQKVKAVYGVLETQFRKLFSEAERRPGQTGENLLKILEMRLDNVVFRLGFADSRRMARQLVRHGHFALNGRKTNIPSVIVKPSDVVSTRGASRNLDIFKIAMEDLGRKSIPSWLSIDPAAQSGRILSVPERTEIDSSVNEHLIVEYYSR